MARLPIPGSDNGTWGAILNDFLSVELNADGTLKASGTIAGKADKTTTITAGTGLTGGGDLNANRTISANVGTAAGTLAAGNDSRIVGAIQSTIVDVKGDLLIASATDTVARQAVGVDGQLLTADSTQANGVKWTNPAQLGSVYPLSANGLFTASENLGSFNGNAQLSLAYFVRVFVPAGRPIIAIGTCLRAAGTLAAGGLNGYAIYTDAGVLVTSTPSDDNMFTTDGWVMKTLASPIVAQTIDRFIYCGICSRGYSVGPDIPYRTGPASLINGGGYGVTGGRRSFYIGIDAWPASFDPISYGTDPGGYLPLLALA